MGILSRILGISRTQKPSDPGCWSFSGGAVEVELAKAPELSQAGGALRLEGGGLPKRVLVVFGEDGRYHAFFNKCSHAGRRLDPLPGQPQVECCSVGKSRFDYSGQYLSGMAKGPVNILPVEMRDSRLVIKLD